jgi:hypothetical protein
MKRIILYISFVFLAFAGNAQVDVKAYLDSNAITIGDQVNLTISVFKTDDAILYFPASDDFGGGKVEVVKQYLDTTFDQSGKAVAFNQISTITSFEDGVDTIAGLKVRCVLPDNSLLEVPLDTLLLVVNDVAVDTALAIKDIAGIVKVPYTFSDFLPWILIVLLVVVVAFLSYYIYKRLKNNKPILPVAKPVVVSPEEKALTDLENLRVAGLWKNGQIKEYHTVLTDILRAYIEAKLGISAVEMTSDQILECYSDLRNMPTGSLEKLQQILTTADMVKFAKAQPEAEVNEECYTAAYYFVENTKVVNEEQNEGKEEITTHTDINE